MENEKDLEPPSGNVRRDLLPRPDPTALTTQQLNREIAGLKEVIFTRLEGMDRAILLCSKASEEGDHRSDSERSH